jgi:hypothetical protein
VVNEAITFLATYESPHVLEHADGCSIGT